MWAKRICRGCDHFCLNNNDALRTGCRAFPDSIPNWIGEKHSHDKILKDQVGDYVYTPATREFNVLGYKIEINE